MRGMAASIGCGRLPLLKRAVLAVDSGARSVSAPEAAVRVAALTVQLATRDILYKTVDSTLRGHVAVELEAAFKASGRGTIVFAPAFPAAGRTTVGGVQLVDGVPVAETVYGRDPVHPACHSALADLVPASLAQVVMLHASTQDELDAKIAAQPNPETILWVGSPGMASALARRLAPVETPAEALGLAAADILIVIGSANPRSHRQAAALRGTAGVTVLHSPAERQDDPVALLSRIADEAVARIRTSATGAVIATGGDTMEAIMQRLVIREFEVLRELEPGFPLGRALLGGERPLLLGMKAGGFGVDETLRRAVAQLHQTSSGQQAS